MPDSSTRVAALLSGQVDWIEAPPPDTVARLKQQKMQVITNVYFARAGLWQTLARAQQVDQRDPHHTTPEGTRA